MFMIVGYVREMIVKKPCMADIHSRSQGHGKAKTFAVILL